MPRRSPCPEPGGRSRRALTAFFLLHWGAVLAWVLPGTPEALEPLPDWMEPTVSAVLPPVLRWVRPVAEPYWDLTATRQTWTLFAPSPAEWVSSVRVVPFFPAAAEGGAARWVADTLLLEGPEQVPYPHLLRHRTYRVLWNLGYEAWGTSYRALFAREMCRTLRTADGRAPDGVVLLDRWTRIPVPWAGGAPDVYDQRLGGFDCAPFSGDGRAAWAEYGLPERIDDRDWPTAASLPPPADDTVGVETAPRPRTPDVAGVR